MSETAYRNDSEVVHLVEKITGTYRYTPQGNENKTTVYFKRIGKVKPEVSALAGRVRLP